MVFVREKISDEDRKKHRIEDRHRSWWIDRSIDAFMLPGWAGAEDYQTFYLYYSGNSIDITTENKNSGDAEEGLRLYYKVINLKVNDSLKESKEEVLEIFKETMEAYVQYLWSTPNRTLIIDVPDKVKEM